MGLTDKNFAIDTIGEYCQCNLIDSSVSVKNPKGIRPEECKTCEYRMINECYPCGSEIRNSCEWTKEFVRVLIEFEQIQKLIDAKTQNTTATCSSCSSDKFPIFCVKDYSF